NLLLLPFDLFRHGQPPVAREITGAPGAAENTSACPDRPIPVRAGGSAVQGELIHLLPEALPQHIVERVIGLLVPKNHNTSPADSRFLSENMSCRTVVSHNSLSS